MPLMMDDELDVDINDLFGDDAGMSIPVSPPPKQLFQRVDELRGSGACQGIAWSRSGCIASILPSGLGLEFRNLRCHPYDGQWALSSPTDYPKMVTSVEGGPLQHICWSPNGIDLAVIDASGRISILAMPHGLNKPSVARNGLMEQPVDDLHAVVGAKWLSLMPVQRPPIIHSHAVKMEKEYRYEVSQAIAFGPCHPNPGKSALICLTTNGLLRLLWMQGDTRWNETSQEIESIVSSNDLITHASICADKHQTLLIAFATTTKQLRIIRVAIKWGNKPGPNEKGQMPAPGQITVNPTLMVVHLAVTNWMDVMPTIGSEYVSQTSMSVLSHLEIIPPAPDGLPAAGQSTLPTVLAVRSYLPASPSQFNQNIESVVDRWELRETPQTIHPAFETMNSRRASTGSPISNAITLSKMEGFTTNKIIISVQPVALDKIICFAYSDGSFEYRDRITMAEAYTNESLERFSHISQIGFSYRDEEPCLQVALSPTTCSFIQLAIDGKYKWKAMRHHMDDICISQNDGQYAAVIAGLTMACSNAIMGPSINYDDVLALTHKYANQKSFISDFLGEVSRVMKFYYDYSEESHHDTLIRNPSIQICLSIQNSLGFRGDSQPRSFGAKVAWLTMQVRNCVVLMTMAASMKMPDVDNPPNKVSGLEDADVIRILSGSVSWCLDLFSWIVDSLLHPEDNTIFASLTAGSTPDLQDLNSRLQTSNNIALHLLLSSASRGFLTAICRRLSHLDYTARKAMATVAQQSQGGVQHQTQGQAPQAPMSPALRDAYTHAATLTQTSTIKVSHFEALLTSLSATIREAYTSAGLPAQSPQQQQQQQNPNQQPQRPGTSTPRNAIEQALLFGGPLPPALTPALTHLFTTLLPTLRAALDPAKLFFHDFSRLTLDPLPSEASKQNNSNGNNNGSNGDGTESDSGQRPKKEKSKAAKDKAVMQTIDIFQRIPIVLPTSANPSSSDSSSPSLANLSINPALNNFTNGSDGGVPKRKYRRCVRCTAVMEDVTSNKQTVHFLVMQQRRCFCSGYWVVMEEGTVVI